MSSVQYINQPIYLDKENWQRDIKRALVLKNLPGLKQDIQYIHCCDRKENKILIILQDFLKLESQNTLPALEGNSFCKYGDDSVAFVRIKEDTSCYKVKTTIYPCEIHAHPSNNPSWISHMVFKYSIYTFHCHPILEKYFLEVNHILTQELIFKYPIEICYEILLRYLDTFSLEVLSSTIKHLQMNNIHDSIIYTYYAQRISREVLDSYQGIYTLKLQRYILDCLFVLPRKYFLKVGKPCFIKGEENKVVINIQTYSRITRFHYNKEKNMCIVSYTNKNNETILEFLRHPL